MTESNSPARHRTPTWVWVLLGIAGLFFLLIVAAILLAASGEHYKGS